LDIYYHCDTKSFDISHTSLITVRMRLMILPKSSSEAKWRKDNLINQYKVLIECHNNNIDYSVDRTCDGGVKSHMGLLSYPDFNPDA